MRVARALMAAMPRAMRPAAFVDMALAALIVLALSAISRADEHVQEWIPDVLVFPDDAEVVSDRAVGSAIRMFSISTERDVAEILATWEENLRQGGYAITQQSDELLDGAIEFSGPGIVNAKIILAPTAETGRNVIQFDATLE
ncbi:hypothetical protein [Roseicyclus sp.]|uniref:hypothetical protein n=1 Tax=Roseicyclus sp. TaxID=1914329 RepID=UPI003FA031C5